MGGAVFNHHGTVTMVNTTLAANTAVGGTPRAGLHRHQGEPEPARIAVVLTDVDGTSPPASDRRLDEHASRHPIPPPGASPPDALHAVGTRLCLHRAQAVWQIAMLSA